jgi:hypothetical protein
VNVITNGDDDAANHDGGPGTNHSDGRDRPKFQKPQWNPDRSHSQVFFMSDKVLTLFGDPVLSKCGASAVSRICPDAAKPESRQLVIRARLEQCADRGPR